MGILVLFDFDFGLVGKGYVILGRFVISFGRLVFFFICYFREVGVVS